VRTFWIVITFVAVATGQAPAGEVAAYNKLRRVRDRALDDRAGTAAGTFVEEARRYLRSHGRSANANRVRVWLGEVLEASDASAAYALYGAAGTQEARARAAMLRWKHESPPPLDVDRWVGPAVDPAAARDNVIALVFLSVTHPQTRQVWPHLLRLVRRDADRGLRVAVVATVVDDRRNQSPERLAAWIAKRTPPFPVAIDRQNGRGPSASFQRYRGASLPWVVLVDRYGRIAWAGGVATSANALQRFERRTGELLAQPTYDQLVRRVRAGDRAALDRLASIRTKRTVDRLLDLLHEDLGAAPRAAVRAALRDLAPVHLTDARRARAQWKKQRKAYAYSLALDRVVKAR